MQAYNASFARVYNLRWGNFATNAAPRLRAYYENTPFGQHNHSLLDLCCGTGQLALHFLDNGYQVTGLDLSDSMLDYARASAAVYIMTGQARFVHGDAADFKFDTRFGLILSTFDALNHLAGLTDLANCFRCAYAALESGGTFIFDLNTEEGLRRWASISVEDTPDLMLVTRALYNEESKQAWTRISGFFPAGEGLYQRFEETASEIAFALSDVRAALLESGFQSVSFARLQDLTAAVDEPDRESRIFIIANKAL